MQTTKEAQPHTFGFQLDAQPGESRQARRIAFTNQKGGVGKTTSVINLGAALSLQGYRVLMVDLDPQANLTYSLKSHKQKIKHSVYELLKGEVEPEQIMIRYKDFDILPASMALSRAEIELSNEPGRETLLSDALDQLQDYDYVFLDCPPNLGLLTLNAFTAANEVYIILQTEYLALHGLSKLTDVVDLVRRRLNGDIEITGIICTLYDKRKNLHREVVKHITDYFGDKVFDTKISDNVSLAEAPSHHRTIFDYDSHSKGAEDYRTLAKEILNRSAA